MARLRRLALLSFALLAYWVPPALADPVVPPTRPARPETLLSDHFSVHYTGVDTATDKITQTQASDIAAMAERAYTAMLGWGYPAPLADAALGGDSRIDIYVVDLTSSGSMAGFAMPDAGGLTTTGSIDLSPTAYDQGVVAHELFHLVQFALWHPSDGWLMEATANWASYKVLGFPAAASGPFDMSLDCLDAYFPATNTHCSLLFSEGGGYTRWSFFEYLAEKYGVKFIRTIFEQGAASASTATPALTAVSSAITASGGTLTSVYNDWATANMTGGYTVPILPTITPATTFTGGILSGELGSTKVSVDHLATKYVKFVRGDPKNTGPCYAAELAITVTIPAGAAGSQPTFWWAQRDAAGAAVTSPIKLDVSGSTAYKSVSWDTCTWGSTYGWVSLPNPTKGLDAQDFTVSAKLVVDKNRIVTVTPPPDPVKMPGTVVTAPTGDVAPTVEVFGPELIRLTAGARVLRLIVSSSGPGQLSAAIGSLQLGTGTVRAGNNDLRFALPASAVSLLRRTAATSGVLTLTPLSPQGAAGKPLVRLLAIEPAAKAKVKAKPKAKAKAKPKANAKAKAKLKAKKKTQQRR